MNDRINTQEHLHPVAVREAKVQWAICCAIARDGHATLPAIVDLSGVRPVALARAIVAMESAGLILRVRRGGALAWVQASA